MYIYELAKWPPSYVAFPSMHTHITITIVRLITKTFSVGVHARFTPLKCKLQRYTVKTSTHFWPGGKCVGLK